MSYKSYIREKIRTRHQNMNIRTRHKNISSTYIRTLYFFNRKMQFFNWNQISVFIVFWQKNRSPSSKKYRKKDENCCSLMSVEDTCSFTWRVTAVLILYYGQKSMAIDIQWCIKSDFSCLLCNPKKKNHIN